MKKRKVYAVIDYTEMSNVRLAERFNVINDAIDVLEELASVSEVCDARDQLMAVDEMIRKEIARRIEAGYPEHLEDLDI